MSIEAALASKLIGEAPVVAIAGTRVWVLRLPQNPVMPAVRVQLISEPREYHLRGDTDARRARVQIDDFVKEASGINAYDVAETLADAIEAAIVTGAPYTHGDIAVLSCFRDNRVPFYESAELRLVRIMQDFLIWWKPV